MIDTILIHLQNQLYFVCEEMYPHALASLLLDDQEQVTLVKVKSYIGRKRGREGEKVRYKESEI